MAKLSLIVLLLLAALCVEGSNHKAGKTKREMKVLRDLLKEELENWRKGAMKKEELLDAREASGDSDDTDESGEAEESAEGEGAMTC